MDDERTETECMLLLVSAMVSNEFGHLDEARQTALAVLSRGEALARPRLQLGALDALMGVAEWRGRWDEVIALEERALALAQDIGATSRIALAQQHLAQAAEALGDFDTAMRWHEQLLPSTRAFGDRRVEVASLQHLGLLQRQRGDLSAAVQWHQQAQTLYEALGDDRGACEAAACAALCETLAGRTDVAVPTVNRLLQRLQGDLVECRAHETMAWRWACQQVLANVGDERAAALLEQLFADVQARAADLTDAADRDRLIQALPVFRAIVAAQAQRGTLTRPARG